MRAAIINPYLDTLGGGERYTLSFAKALVDLGYDVDLEWKSPNIITKLENRFGLDLGKINVRPNLKRGEGYDLCFWVSDGSIPTLRSRRNILHFQVPFHSVNGKTLLNRMKLIRVEKIICNSKFTKRIVDREYGFKSIVVYPPVDTEQFKPKRKENIILYVGRFSTLKQSKGQDTLIKAFKKIVDAGNDEWRLILAGGAEVGTGDYLNKLKKSIKDYPVEIIKSPDFNKIKEYYGKAKIYWSASGHGIDEVKEPEKVEHFGITVTEAMSAGCVPIIYKAGGHKEIIVDGENGFLWDNTRRLIAVTKKIITDSKSMYAIGRQAMVDSRQFGLNKFNKRVKEIIKQN